VTTPFYLIEGAHEGAGLGHQFLRHVERCHVLVHLVEGANPAPGRDPAADFAAINRELKLHSRKLAAKPQVVAITKVDIPEARQAGERWARVMARRKVPVKVHLLSSATREGLEGLLDDVAAAIWTDVAPHGGGRPKKAGRPRAAVEAAEPYVPEAAEARPAKAAVPKRAAPKKAAKAKGPAAKKAVKAPRTAPKKAVAKAAPKRATKKPVRKAVAARKKAVATRSRR
jgi:hypothetical protein